ncbi:MAG: T9SS type A sorting domain-containing protein [Paludibacter sp.]
MKTIKNLSSTLFFLIITTSCCYAINYNISFTGTGASSSIDSVVVKNLTNGSTLTLKSGFDLNLSDNTNSLDQQNSNKQGIYVSMNAIHGNSIVTFYANQTGEGHINVFGTDGRQFLGKTDKLQEGNNSFELSLPKGKFIIKIDGKGYTYTTKLVNETGISKIPAITIINKEQSGNVLPQKIKNTSVQMSYSNGDLLLYKGFSGNLRTIITEVPTKSKTTNFEFVECKDANQNYYTVVKIGAQTWMAENLNATAYRNSDPISIITSDT